MEQRVFISYASANREEADAVCHALETAGIPCWIAPRDVSGGVRYAEAIIEAIHSARLLVLVFSAAANRSVHVERELDRAVSVGLSVLPLRIENLEPSGAMEYYLAGRQWFDAIGLDRSRLASLCSVVAGLLPAGQAPAHGNLSPRAGTPHQERKVVTTLICDLVSFTAMTEAADPEDVDAILNRYHQAAHKAIESYGGTVEKFIGDAVVGVFGVPAVHEDDAERAVRAGLRIIVALEGMRRPDGSPLEARIGINTGEALVRLDIDPLSGQGFLTGDSVNAAARLETAAPVMGVLVGETTYRLTERVIRYEQREPIVAKGKKEPVAAWLAEAPVSRLGIDVDRDKLTPFVGRELELSYLRALLDKAISSSSPQFALIVGEPGIGKSRLVQELFAYVDSRPVITTWRQGRCLPYGEGVAFWALAEIVKAQAGILESDGADTVAAKLEAVVPEGADRAWLANRLRALVGLEAPQAEREENFTAWLRFVEYLALDQPLVVVLEDLHWADDGLLAFVEHLATHADAVPLLLVATARPELFERHPTFASGTAQVNRISLGPLASEDSQRLVASLLADRDAVGQTVADIVERSEGNPFFAEESARMFGDGVRGASVPASVQAVVAARLDALAVEQKAVLADAAVVGEVFWDGAVAEVGHRERDAVDDALRELVGKGLVRRVRESSMAGESEFAFAHVLARDVAYAALPRRVRAEKHAKVGSWLESSSGERLADQSELVTHHRVSALELAQAVGDAELIERCRAPAVAALRLAGERTMRLDVGAAERLFARAVDLCVDGDVQRAELFQAWALSLMSRGRYGEAKSNFEESVRCFLAEGRSGKAAMAMTGLEKALFNLGGGEWSAVLADALELTADEPESEARALVMTAMGAARIVRADYAGGLEWVQRAVDVYVRRGTKVPLDLQQWQAQAECGLGDRGAGDRLLEVARAMRDEGSGRETGVAYTNAQVLRYPFEGPRAYYDVAEEALEFLRSRGISGGQGLVAINRCEGLHSEGRWEEALLSLEALREWLEQRDDQFALLFWWQIRAQILATMGRVSEALACAHEADEHAQTWGEPWIGARARTSLVMALASAGEGQRAVELLRELAAAPRLPGYQGDEDSIPELMRCALKYGEWTLAEQLVQGIEAGMPLMDYVLATGRSLLAEARDEHEAAAAGSADAAARWRDFGVPYEEGQALLGQGRCLAALGRAQEAGAPLAAAREIFARLGAKPALAETNELMQHLATA